MRSLSTTINIYSKVWRALAINELQSALTHRATNLFFLFGKFLRMGMLLVFLFIIKDTVDTFAGYTSEQAVVFYLTYQFVDVIGQTFYRGVYTFSNKVRTGEFDFTLVKPISSLFLTLTGQPDINDALFLLPTIAISVYLFSTLGITTTLPAFLIFLALLINSFLIVTALHILVLVVGILTTEVDGVIWFYRDLIALGRYPVSIYIEPIRTLLFFLVPAGFMITIPAEVLLNVSPTYPIILSFVIGITIFALSLKIWNWALTQYSSASS